MDFTCGSTSLDFVFLVSEDKLLPLPIVDVVWLEAVLVFKSELTYKRCRFCKLSVSTLNHSELDHNCIALHVQVLVHKVRDLKTTVHHSLFPVEVVLHKATHLATTGHSCFRCKVCALNDVHYNRLTIDSLQILKVEQLDVQLTENLLLWQLSFLDEIDRFCLATS